MWGFRIQKWEWFKWGLEDLRTNSCQVHQWGLCDLSLWVNRDGYDRWPVWELQHHPFQPSPNVRSSQVAPTPSLRFTSVHWGQQFLSTFQYLVASHPTQRSGATELVNLPQASQNDSHKERPEVPPLSFAKQGSPLSRAFIGSALPLFKQSTLGNIVTSPHAAKTVCPIHSRRWKRRFALSQKKGTWICEQCCLQSITKMLIKIISQFIEVSILLEAKRFFRCSKDCKSKWSFRGVTETQSASTRSWELINLTCCSSNACSLKC